MKKNLVSFELNDETVAVIDSIKNKLELDSNAAVFRKAITLLKLASESDKVILISEGAEKEVIL